MKPELMEKYARLVVRSGVNVQKGQLLVINASARDYEFVRMCVKEAFEAGAGEVQVKWSDEIVNKLVYEADDEMLSFYKAKSTQARRRSRGHSQKKKRPANNI